jgi:sec-independent protein translocase protein TatB
MLDIGFAELLVVLAIALFVVGPERLPSTIRSLSLWLGRLKRSFEEIKSDVSRELHNEEVMRALAEGKDQIKDVTDVGTVIETETTRALTDEPESPKSPKSPDRE